MARNVLFFGENAISPVQGGGIVVYSALRGLDPDHLLGFYRYVDVTPAVEYASRFRLMGRTGNPSSADSALPASPLSYLPPSGVNWYVRQAKNRIKDLARPLLAVLGPDWAY